MCSCIPIWFQHNTYRYYIIPTDDVPERSNKIQQIDNISQIKNDIKTSNKGEKKNDDLLFGTKPAPQCSTGHYKSLKLNLRACDSCWLVIGNHRGKKKKKKNTPLRVHDTRLVCRTRHEANSGCKKRKKQGKYVAAFWKVRCGASQMQDLLSRVWVQHPSLPNLIDYQHGTSHP